MDILHTEHKRCTVIKTNGRIDGSNAPDLGKALKEIMEKGVFNIVFDMTEVNFMASAGWWVLIDTQKTCKQLNRGELVLATVEKGIQDSLKLVGMESYFKHFENVTTAVGSF
jgi:anti-anti-sigma factor